VRENKFIPAENYTLFATPEIYSLRLIRGKEKKKEKGRKERKSERGNQEGRKRTPEKYWRIRSKSCVERERGGREGERGGEREKERERERDRAHVLAVSHLAYRF